MYEPASAATPLRLLQYNCHLRATVTPSFAFELPCPVPCAPCAGQALSVVRDGGLEELAGGCAWAMCQASTPLALLTPPLPEAAATSGAAAAVAAAMTGAGTGALGPALGLVSEALGPTAQPPFIPAELLGSCAAMDGAAAAAAADRDAVVAAALAALVAYSRALRLLLPASYAAGAWHQRYGTTLAALCTAGSAGAAAEPLLLQGLAASVPKHPSDGEVEEVRRTWEALRAAFNLHLHQQQRFEQERSQEQQQAQQALRQQLLAMCLAGSDDGGVPSLPALLPTPLGDGAETRLTRLLRRALRDTSTPGSLRSSQQKQEQGLLPAPHQAWQVASHLLQSIADGLPNSIAQLQEEARAAHATTSPSLLSQAPLGLLAGHAFGLRRLAEACEAALEQGSAMGGGSGQWSMAFAALSNSAEGVCQAVSAAMAASEALRLGVAADWAVQLSLPALPPASPATPDQASGAVHAVLRQDDAGGVGLGALKGSEAWRRCEVELRERCERLAALLQHGWRLHRGLERVSELLALDAPPTAADEDKDSAAAAGGTTGAEQMQPGENVLLGGEAALDALLPMPVIGWEGRHAAAEQLRDQSAELAARVEQAVGELLELTLGPGGAAAFAAATAATAAPMAAPASFGAGVTAALQVGRQRRGGEPPQSLHPSLLLQRLCEHVEAGGAAAAADVAPDRPHCTLGSAMAALLQLHDALARAQQPPADSAPAPADPCLPCPVVPPGLAKWQAAVQAAFALRSCLAAATSSVCADDLPVAHCPEGAGSVREVDIEHGQVQALGAVQSALALHVQAACAQTLVPVLVSTSRSLAQHAQSLAQGDIAPLVQAVGGVQGAKHAAVMGEGDGGTGVEEVEAAAGELVRFQDFDPGIAGEGEELGGLEEDEQQQQQGAGSVEVGWREEGEWCEGEGQEEEGSESAEVVREAIAAAFAAGGAAAAEEAEVAVRVSVPRLVGWEGQRQEARLRLLAAYGWMHEHLLEPLSGAGTSQGGAEDRHGVMAGAASAASAPLADVAALTSDAAGDTAACGADWGQGRSSGSGAAARAAPPGFGQAATVAVAATAPAPPRFAPVRSPGEAVRLYLERVRDPLGFGAEQLLPSSLASHAAEALLSSGGYYARAPLLAAVRALTERLPALEQQLVAWEGTSQQAAAQVQQQLLHALAASGSPAGASAEAAVVVQVRSTLLL